MYLEHQDSSGCAPGNGTETCFDIEHPFQPLLSLWYRILDLPAQRPH